MAPDAWLQLGLAIGLIVFFAPFVKGALTQGSRDMQQLVSRLMDEAKEDRKVLMDLVDKSARSSEDLSSVVKSTNRLVQENINLTHSLVTRIEHLESTPARQTRQPRKKEVAHS